jgi:hypothetical protein
MVVTLGWRDRRETVRERKSPEWTCGKHRTTSMKRFHEAMSFPIS